MNGKTFTYSSTNFSAAELMQYRSPVDGGPSLNRWPRCASHTLHTTSVLIMPRLLSVTVLIFCSEAASQKLGQPVPDSNFVFESNRSAPQLTH